MVVIIFLLKIIRRQLIVDKIIEYFQPKNKKIFTLERGNLEQNTKAKIENLLC